MQLREVPFVPDVLYEKKMTERNLFAEMTEGFDALVAAREGKKTLLTTEVEIKPAVEAPRSNCERDTLYTFDGYSNITRGVFKLKFFGCRFSSVGRATAL